MLPDPDPAGPRLLLMVGAPLLGPYPPRTSLRAALRSGLAARIASAAATYGPVIPAMGIGIESYGRCGVPEEG